MYVTYTRIYGWSDYGGESSYQPGYRLENMMWMTLLVYDYIIPGEKKIELKEIPLGDTYCYGLDVYNPAWVWRYKMYYNIPGDIELKFPER